MSQHFDPEDLVATCCSYLSYKPICPYFEMIIVMALLQKNCSLKRRNFFYGKLSEAQTKKISGEICFSCETLRFGELGFPGVKMDSIPRLTIGNLLYTHNAF